MSFPFRPRQAFEAFSEVDYDLGASLDLDAIVQLLVPLQFLVGSKVDDRRLAGRPVLPDLVRWVEQARERVRGERPPVVDGAFVALEVDRHPTQLGGVLVPPLGSDLDLLLRRVTALLGAFDKQLGEVEGDAVRTYALESDGEITAG
jgi:hypothetical protein